MPGEITLIRYSVDRVAPGFFLAPKRGTGNYLSIHVRTERGLREPAYRCSITGILHTPSSFSFSYELEVPSENFERMMEKLEPTAGEIFALNSSGQTKTQIMMQRNRLQGDVTTVIKSEIDPYIRRLMEIHANELGINRLSEINV